MKNLLNLVLILTTVLNQFVVLGTLPARPAAVPTSQAAAAAPVAAPVVLPPAAPTAVPAAEPVLEARFPKPPLPDPVFPQETAQKVPPGGGEVSGLDGKVKMRFPENTFEEEADVWIAPVDQEHMPANDDPERQAVPDRGARQEQPEGASPVQAEGDD